MHKYLFLVLAALFAGCGAEDRTANDHSEHRTNMSQSTNSSSANHADMKHDSPMDHSQMKSSEGAASVPIELQFLDSMIVHHKGAVDMAMLAETRAEHAELKELAANIISEQEREIAKMSEWRDQWFEGKAEAVNMEFPGMSHGMRGMDLKKLQSLNGNEFDIELLKQMIPHHEGAVEMAKAISKNDSRKELQELARDIITAQEDEIRQMRGWLSKWQR